MKHRILKRAKTPEELAGLRALRLEVFVREQGIPKELELDDLDEGAIHAIVLDGQEVVATGRLVLLSESEARIGRMAVRGSLRRQGLGRRVLKFLEEEAKARDIQSVVLHAQSYLQDFYRRLGYRQEGTPFLEAGIEHIIMTKTLP